MVITMNEYTISIIKKVLEVILIPLLGYLVRRLVLSWEKKLLTDEELAKAKIAETHLAQLNSIIFESVKATNQTLVNPLKEQGLFDDIAKDKAFTETLNLVRLALTEETKASLALYVDDLETYISSKIEASIEEAKKK